MISVIPYSYYYWVGCPPKSYTCVYGQNPWPACQSAGLLRHRSGTALSTMGTTPRPSFRTGLLCRNTHTHRYIYIYNIILYICIHICTYIYMKTARLSQFWRTFLHRITDARLRELRSREFHPQFLHRQLHLLTITGAVNWYRFFLFLWQMSLVSRLQA